MKMNCLTILFIVFRSVFADFSLQTAHETAHEKVYLLLCSEIQYILCEGLNPLQEDRKEHKCNE